MDQVYSALRDWRRSFGQAPLWFNLALEDLRDRYRRTVFGVAWIVVSFALFVAVKVVVFGQMVSVPQAEFGLFVTIGFGLWTFVNAMVVDACTAYMHSRAWILGTAIPYPVFLLQAVLRNCIVFALVLGVMALALPWKPTPWTANAWLAIPGLLAYPVTSLWLAMILAPLCARFRDLHHAIQTGMRLLFFVTPILWMPQISPTLARIAELNPLTSFVEIVRAPLLYGQVPTRSWEIVLWINVAGLLLGLLAYVQTRKRIAYWV